MQISYTWGLDAHWLISTYQLRACLQASLLVEIVCVLSSLVCNLYQAVRSLSHGGIEYRSHNGDFSVMSRKSSRGNVSGYYRNLGSLRVGTKHHEVAVLAARPAKQRSVSDSDVLVACITFYTASQLVSICMRFAYFATIGQSFGLA